MKALILCDGSEGSLRCVEAACADQTTDASLIFLHVWDSPVKTNTAGASNGDGVASHSPSIASTPQTTNTASEAVSAPTPPSTAAGAQPTPTLSCAEVLAATLRAVHMNKYVKGRAHYCVETVSASAIDAAKTTTSAMDESKPYLVEVSSTPGPDRFTASHRLSEGVSINAPNLSVANVHTMSMVHPVVRQAMVRAAHHRVEAVFVGVGQRQEGKLCRVGGVAVCVLQHLRHTYPLYYLKKDGVKWRPAPVAAAPPAATTTAMATASPIRFTIVVPIPSSNSQALLESTGAFQSEACCDARLAPVKAAVDAAVRYVQQHCVRTISNSSSSLKPVSVDSIGFLLIAPSSASSNESHGDAAVVEEGETVEAESAKAVESKDVPIVGIYKRYLETLLSSTVQTSPPGGPLNEQEGEANTSSVLESASRGTSDEAPSKNLSPIIMCTLKPNKKNPIVTLDNAEVALPQIVKQVTALKPDVLVMATSLVPEALQLSMLATGKSHCVVLPC